MLSILIKNSLRYSRKSIMNFCDAPIVVVLGATGAGKSKLAIEIAEEFDGEIISADSMQVYKGLDIISNKVTPEEQEQVPHHMIDIVEPTTNYSVVKFRDTALSIIEDLRGRQKLPVIVGGTNYYIEAVLWKILVADRASEGSNRDEDGGTADQDRSEGSENGLGRTVDGTKSTADRSENTAGRPERTADGPESVTGGTVASKEGAEDVAADGGARSGRGDCDRRHLERLSTEELYAQLRERDPVQAQILHPNERRKILRSLEVTLRSGRPMSDHLRQQRAEAGGGAHGGPLRFQRACLLWVTADQETLDRRLDARVDTMMERGLLDELADFHRRYNAARLADGVDADYTHGIFQSIGFKEFHGYLTRPKGTTADEAKALLAEGVERLKLVTRRYARKQTRWVRRRFLSAVGRQVPPVYRLDATDPRQWEEEVRAPAAAVVRDWLQGKTPNLAPEPVVPTNTGDRTTYHCAVCDVYTSGAQQRDEHLRSRRHHRALHSLKRSQAAEGGGDAKRAALGGGMEGEGVAEVGKGEECQTPKQATVVAEQTAGEGKAITAELPTEEGEAKGSVQGAA
ncbi:tRNA dimethylallyltransferase-like [Amphibalanus amphitrite]|uniref:tRNA dimethylallyltransferase-like n=1 Tax=Amphibalanus amphitrite TaxID=1232801 RepID=UPI001C8FDF25|nr:tRNA dimethylallyltransferase-like [Amphibalanus amphitrite]XP_043210269.1 tRNA dimethylallyltransferase-like [Amphibalanus amphitrite]XP_043210270.1 tRNA dimethylallyltransferase-like [Amphibalanus amphitrite]